MQYLPDNAVNIFTDGSCKPKPRRGGIGFRIVVTGEDGHERVHDESPNGYRDATNNQMELKACIAALDFLGRPQCPVDLTRFRKVIIYTDSQYVHRNLGTAINRWSKTRWMRTTGPPVLNPELWKELIRAMKRCPVPVRIEWVPGKASEHTKAVDKLAKSSADRPYNRPITISIARPKLVPDQHTEAGSVPMQGQVLDVYIVGAESLKVQRCSRYRYQVVGGDLDGAIDWAFSELHLRPRHTYRVRFNDDQDYPQIEELIYEIKTAERP